MKFQTTQPTSKAPAETFTGDAWVDHIVRGEAPSRVRAALVRFAPGARNAWHAHAVGQTVHVTEGVGRIQARGEPVLEMRAGDTVVTPAGEWHWHGAAPERFMTHLAIWEAPEEGRPRPSGVSRCPTRSTGAAASCARAVGFAHMDDSVAIVPADPSLVDAAAVATGLDVDPTTGLSAAEAAARLAQDGPNELRAKPPVPVWRKILAQFQDPLVYLLLVAIVISLVAWIAEGALGAPVDVIVIAAIVIANAALGFVQENRAENAVAALAVMTAASSTVLRDGVLATVPSSGLVRGDILVLSEGDSVGADARLLTATGLKVQEASLTGESDATLKDPATLEAQAPIGDRFDMVFKGTAVVQGVGRAVVTGTGMRTEMGAIAHMLDETEAVDSPLQKEIASISRALGLIVIGIAVVVMVAIAVLNGVDSPADFVTILLMGVSLAVAAVPEGLPAILSLVLAIGVRALAQRNAVMKNLHSVETLGSASVICSDKTGTLTRNEMTLRTVVTASGEVELTGIGYRPEGEALLRGGAEDAVLFEARRVLVGGVLANNAQLAEIDGEWRIQGDPTEAAFLVAQHKLEGTANRVARYERQAEVPFTSERKMMSVLAQDPLGETTRLFTKGAPDILLARCEATAGGDGDRRHGRGAARSGAGRRRAPLGAGLPDARRRVPLDRRRWQRDDRGPGRVRRARPRLPRPCRHHRPAARGGVRGGRRGASRRHPHHHDHRRPPGDGPPDRVGPRHRRPGRPGRSPARSSTGSATRSSEPPPARCRSSPASPPRTSCASSTPCRPTATSWP